VHSGIATKAGRAAEVSIFCTKEYDISLLARGCKYLLFTVQYIQATGNGKACGVYSTVNYDPTGIQAINPGARRKIIYAPGKKISDQHLFT